MKKLLVLALLLSLTRCAYAADVISITGMSQDNSPTTDDVMITVDSPGTSAKQTKKVTLSSLRSLMLAGDGSNLSGLTQSQITGTMAESNLSFTDITTNNVSTSKHGFVPKAPNDSSKFLDGTGAYSTPSTSAAGGFTDDGTIVHNTTLTDNVGIGTVTTPAKLTVAGGITATGVIAGSSFTGNATTATLAATATAFAANGANCTTPAFPLGVDASGAAESCTTLVRPTDIDTSSELRTILTDETGTGSLVFATGPNFTANVGIGSASPGKALDVQGSIRASTGFYGDGTNITNAGGWTHSGTNMYQSTITDNVGIGTALPTLMLDVGAGHIWGVGSTGLMTINGGTVPSALSSFGQFTSDSDFWASGHGAPLFYDGTTTVALLGAVSSDAPADGEVPTWHTGGLITFDPPAGGTATLTGDDTGVFYSDGVNSPATDASNFNYNKTTKVLTAGSVQTAVATKPSLSLAASGTDSDWIIGVNGSGGTDDDPLYIGIGTTIPDALVKFVVKRDGNVGVGTTLPPNNFYVAGTAESQGFKMNSGASSGYVMVSGSTGIGTWMSPSSIGAAGGGSGYWVTGNVGINTTSNVGIGSVNPGQKLDVVGTVRATAFVGDGTGLSGVSGSGTVNSATKYNIPYYAATGTTLSGTSGALVFDGTNVGIGTTVPSDYGYPLMVVKSGVPQIGLLNTAAYSNSGGPTLSFITDTGSAVTSGSRIGKIDFNGATDTTRSPGSLSGSTSIESFAEENWSGSTSAAQLRLATTASGAGRTAKVYITGGGNVGIGSATPTAFGGGVNLDIIDNSTASLMGEYIKSTSGSPILGISGPTGSKTVNFSLYDNNASTTDTQKAGISLCRDSSPPVTGCGRNDVAFFTSSGSGKKIFISPEANGAIGQVITSTGNVGFGTSSPAVQLEVKGGDFYVNTTAAKIHLREPDGTCCYLSASNAEALTCTSETCP